MIPLPVAYRWDQYGCKPHPTPWRTATPGKLLRAFRALLMPRERIRVRYDNGQEVIWRLRR